MIDSILNTPAETKYRLLLLLSVVPNGQYSLQWISAMDFMSVYGKTFNIGDQDLHGDSWMKFTEYATRFWNIRDALHELVLNGWTTAEAMVSGYSYRITAKGRSLADEFSVSYVQPMRANIALCYERYGTLSGKELDAMIRKAALTSMEQGDRDG